MKAKVYVETTIISYVAASPSRDLVVAAHQQITREWWERRDRFELFVSQAVVEEAARGDVAAAARRAALLSRIPVLELRAEVHDFANRLLRTRIVPAKASMDALHIAVAVVNRVDYLVTWNCVHIANAAIRVKIDRECQSAGLHAPVICTPEELMEG